ncbi:MAG: 6-carboxytetrahydropterin synthase [Bacteroidales bacterium]|nr:6-carboxytetrahydropterin synthase [Bacteroidales bacterium]
MFKIRITKRFTFEMAHALLGYDGLCKNIHGHSYILWVTLRGEPDCEEQNPKNGMLMDFSVLSKLIKDNIISKYDHALLLNKNTNGELLKSFSSGFERIILLDYQPTCENIIADMACQIKNVLPINTELFSLKLQETETAFAEWFLNDNL